MRRRLLGAAAGIAVSGAVVGTVGCDSAGQRRPEPVTSDLSAPPLGTALAVDFRRHRFPLDVWSLGGTILTQWGRRGRLPVTIASDATWRNRLAELGPLHWRIPLDMELGVPSSRERLDGRADGLRYLRAIRAMSGTPYPIILGDRDDNSFTPAQVSRFVHYFNDGNGQPGVPPIRRLILGNEPDNAGTAGVRSYLGMLDEWISAAKDADPAIRISAPGASHWGDEALMSQGAAKNRRVDILGYHAYDGSNRGGGPPAFPDTKHYHSEITQLRSLRPGILGYALEEVNFGSRLGTAPLYDYRNSVWLASVIGQVLTAGGNVSTFADLNGSFGMMNDGTGEDHQPGALYTRFPAYWAVGMWTGMNGQFRRFGQWTVPATSAVDLVDIFATDNGKIVIVNKAGQQSRRLSVGLGGRVTGYWSMWQTARDRPTEAPRRVVDRARYASSRLEVRLPAGTVSSLQLD